MEYRANNRRFIVSGRRILPTEDIIVALRNQYGCFGFEQIHCVYGFVYEYSSLYGGRGNRNMRPFLADAQIAALRSHGIYFDLVLSNHFFSERAYEETKPILEKLHLPGNGIVCQTDELAERIREDFPQFSIRASMIRGFETKEDIEAALKSRFDYVTLPMNQSENAELLASLDCKDRVIVFGNAFCAYSCPTTPCYSITSHSYFGTGKTITGPVCTGNSKTCDYLEFDLDSPTYEGYSFFKLIPPKLGRLRK